MRKLRMRKKVIMTFLVSLLIVLSFICTESVFVSAATSIFETEWTWPVKNYSLVANTYTNTYKDKDGKTQTYIHTGIDICGDKTKEIVSPVDAEVYRVYTGCKKTSGNYTCRTYNETTKTYTNNLGCDPNHDFSGTNCNVGYGNGVCLKFTDNGKTYYIQLAHMSEVYSNIKETNKVTAGTPLGKMGVSGGATGVHTHFEIRVGGEFGKNSSGKAIAVNPLKSIKYASSSYVNQLPTNIPGISALGSYTFYDPLNNCSHTWDSGKVTKAATTSTTGIRTYTCTKCGETKTETIPKITSNTCSCSNTYAGWYKVNNAAGLDINSGHNFNSSVQELKNGTFVYVTKASGSAGTSGAIGHTYLRSDYANKTNYYIAMRFLKAVTPAEVCSGYGKHYTERRLKSAATCTQGAIYQNYCVICSKFVGSPENPTGSTISHTFGSWVTKSSATCTTLATRKAKCSVCNNEYGSAETYGSYVAHTWNSGAVTKAATCAGAGEKTYTCTVCNKTMTEVIDPITTHTWNAGIVTKSPNCTTEGERTYTCNVCNVTKTEPIGINSDAHTADPNKPDCCVYCGKAVFDISGPVISGIYVTDLTSQGYTVYCTVSDANGITNVKFPTWTKEGPNDGQDDLGAWWSDSVYFGTAVEENETGTKYKYVVKTSDHNNEGGHYITHIYAYDTLGNYTGVGVPELIYVDNTDPQFAWVKVTDVDKTGYTVTCMVTDDYVLDKVCFPTWTEAGPNYGQDDLNDWQREALGTHESGEAWEGAIYSFRVNTSEHNNEGGNYITHLYVYDVFGNGAKYDMLPSIYIDNVAPSISDIVVTDVTRDGYTVECTVADNYQLASVSFPTWNQAIGTDNIDVKSEQYIGAVEGNRYTYTVSVDDYNYQRGMYYTEVNAIDSFGNLTKELVSVELPLIVISEQPQSRKVNSGEQITLKVTALGENLNYQWQVSPDGVNWTNASGAAAKNAEYIFVARSNNNGDIYRCIIETTGMQLITEQVSLEVNVITMSEVSVDLSEDIVLNYYLSIPDTIRNLPDAYFVFNWDGKTERIYVSSLTTMDTPYGERYKVSLGIPAAHITDTIQLGFYYNDKMVGSMICGSDEKYVYSTSVEKYLQTINESVFTEQKVRDMAEAVLIYGYAADNYFRNSGHATNRSIMDLTPEDMEIEQVTSVVERKDETVESIGYTLILDSSVKARGYFKRNEEVVVDTTEGIMASDLMHAQTLQCGDMTVKYYPMEYVKNVVYESEDSNLVYLCKTLYNYAKNASEWNVY